ncbi:ATP-dependent protease subunit HslV [Desulfoferrobacter suflitae]|uniref:ATP-dependent protease subunit HslV n=1 Tax=Desulfoferrobacter suflitae TaxID=2865782 RepID=UPI002164777C|nr:ATP-dependent protease subunit HslV [Desulfoferrobacter suflitae]MCK8601298.1 ATP-dependent protease subunit HslV [Desulfoferrobacter suflitae]
MTQKQMHGTTILAMHKDGQVVMAGDGQVTLGDTVVKHQAKKVRKMYHDKILTGFAGATADAFTLFERLEGKLEQYNGNLKRAAVELAKDWRMDRALRRLEALLIAVDRNDCLILSGSGDVIEPDDHIAAVGSGGSYALAAARALAAHSQLSARQIVEEAMRIAASICIYTNSEFTIQEL